MNAPVRHRQRAQCLGSIAPVTDVARMPNEAWLAFLSGALSPEDWALISRVEAGEVSVDVAMAQRELLQ
ncbi:hypothetical protein [Sphingomonas koreensis]